MRIVFDNCFARAEDVTPAEEAWLFDFLSFSDSSARHRGKKGQRFRLYDMRRRSFPTGNLGAVVRQIEHLKTLVPMPEDLTQIKDGQYYRPDWLDEFTLVDRRVQAPAPNPNAADLEWLRWYQREAVLAVCQRKRGIIRVPTGGGKTEIAIGIYRAIPCRWLFVAHRSQLALNAAKRFMKRERERLMNELAMLHHIDAGTDEVTPEMFEEIEQQLDNLRCGMFGDGKDDVLNTDRFVVATFQSLHAAIDGRGGEILRSAQGIIIDECHVQPATTFFRVTQEANNAFYRIGLSGTPLQRGDQRNVMAIGALGRLIYRIRAKTLIDEGTFAYPIMRFVKFDVESEIPPDKKCPTCKGEGQAKDLMTNTVMVCEPCKGTGFRKPKYPSVYKRAIVESEKRNALVVDIAKGARKPCMLFVEKLDHGRRLSKAIGKAGITSAFVAGMKTTAQREKAVEQLRRGHLDVLITTRIMQEGIDVPELESVVNGGAGKSGIKIVQELGRGARATESKKTFEFWDVFDYGHTSLQRQANARRKAMKDETECPVETLGSGENLPLPGVFAPP